MTILWLLAIFFIIDTAVGSLASAGIDLLESLQLHNSSRQGVTLAPGPQRLRPAFYLQGDYRDLRLPQSVYQQAVQLLRHNPEFTVAASLRQEEANSGTIVSFSHGFNRYLELQSSGRKDEIRLHYTGQRDAMVHVETFPYRLADNVWHKVAVSISGSQVQLLVDCHPLYRRLLGRPPDTNFTLPQLTLWVGQRNNKHSLFKGALQDVRLITGPHGYLNQCPHLDTSCPTCGEYTLLQNTVEQLTRHLQELSQRLVAVEDRINRVEECDCQKSCVVNGSVHADGASWQRDCDICSCVHGEVQCRPVQCPPITCKNPVLNPGECCKSCLKQCYLRGTLYDHGDSVNLKQCVECECRDGSMHCTRIDPETMCPPLPCAPSQQFSVPDECCKFCPGVDYCSKGHKCHRNASCLNLETTYACHCNAGFSGDGHSCYDVDECQNEGGLEGHHCHSNTRCVNTEGGYECECLPGHRRLDRFNCVEVDECSTGEHQCDEHATCRNTQGSYYCECHEGYSGDGYKCTPICDQTCLNGGECVRPGVCQCRKGYMGPSCELDLDECVSGLHSCQASAVCVNMPGWYYCRCKPGYRSTIRPDSTLGTTCQDLDECSNGSHTCHPSAKCVNIEGGFQCTCDHKSLFKDGKSDCRLSCMLEGNEIENGMVVTPNGAPCKRCTCTSGVLSCVEPQCDCSKQGSEHDKCCPQCDPKAACRHQELRHVVFRSGERWIYQCQTCECLFGEVDCWQMECPPLTCREPVLTPGDCCPRCHDDPCSLDTSNSSVSSGQPCAYAGKLYDSGSYWNDPYDKCTACNCKDGRLCCTFDTSCGNINEQPPVADSLIHQPAPFISTSKSPEALLRSAINPISSNNNEGTVQQQQSSDFKINNVNTTSDNTSTTTLPKYSDKLYNNNNVNITEIKEHNNSSDINSDNSSNYVNASNISSTTATAG